MGVKFSELPEWARTRIQRAGPRDMYQESRNGQSLQISNGVARFNGQVVSIDGQTKEETIQLSQLPPWAQDRVKKTNPWSSVQINQNGVSLQIVAGVAHFNGKRVIC